MAAIVFIEARRKFEVAKSGHKVCVTTSCSGVGIDRGEVLTAFHMGRMRVNPDRNVVRYKGDWAKICSVMSGGIQVGGFYFCGEAANGVPQFQCGRRTLRAMTRGERIF